MLALKQNNGKYDKKMYITKEMRSELSWWINNLLTPMIETDASLSWGTYMKINVSGVDGLLENMKIILTILSYWPYFIN